MRKVYLVFILTFFVTPLVFSDTNNTESITISTYYPAPFGVYKELRSTELQSEKIAVGDTNNDGQITSADQPSRAGDIRFKPQPGDPSSWPFGNTGQLTYSSMNDEFYHYNGSEWVAQGGGTGYFLQCGNSCPSGTSYVGNAAYGTAIGGIVAASGVVNAVCTACLGCPGGSYKIDCYKSTQLMSGSYQTPCGGVSTCGTYFAAGCFGLPDNLSNCKMIANCAATAINDISVCK